MNTTASPSPNSTAADNVVLKTAALQWLCMLLSNRPEEMLELSMELFDPLFQTLSHPDTEVVIAALQVLARIMNEAKVSTLNAAENLQDVAQEQKDWGKTQQSKSLAAAGMLVTSSSAGGGASSAAPSGATITGTSASKSSKVKSRTVVLQENLPQRTGASTPVSMSSVGGASSSPGSRIPPAVLAAGEGGMKQLQEQQQSSQPERIRISKLFQGVCRKLLDLFRIDSQMFDQRGRLVVRQLCDKLDCELFYRTVAGIVSEERELLNNANATVVVSSSMTSRAAAVQRHRQFLAQAVEMWHWILLTSRETAHLRDRLLREKVGGTADVEVLESAVVAMNKSSSRTKAKATSSGEQLTSKTSSKEGSAAKSKEEKSQQDEQNERNVDSSNENAKPSSRTTSLFVTLLLSWVSDPLSAVSLALWCEQYELAHRLCQRLAAAQSSCTENFLNQLDQLVHLFESPVFLRARMHLLTPRKFPDLVKTLVALCMMLPQSAAFDLLQKRLALSQNGLVLEENVSMEEFLDNSEKDGGDEDNQQRPVVAKLPTEQVARVVRLLVLQ